MSGVQRTPRLLERCGYQVKCIGLGTSKIDGVIQINEAHKCELIQWLEKEQPDLMLVEDSSIFWTVIPELKKNPKTLNIPVLITVCLPKYYKQDWWQSIEADGYYEVPINFSELINKIEITLKQKPTSELILELIEANSQGLTIDEIEQKINRNNSVINRFVNSLVEKELIKRKGQEKQFIYYPAQQDS
ncbi:BlaI/MecI/CopY family transcriptional regulator [Limnoraphis robusta Tam1]|nr:BlaI/MecI/CopY family transcriptional regulator [Limnoraphis robusta Tam1]